MASAAVVGGVLLALIEGMGIMFTKMTAPPVPTAEDYERAARQDPTAPPLTTSMMASVMGNTTAPPPTTTMGTEMSMETVFSTEGSSSSDDAVPKKSTGGWFGFGS